MKSIALALALSPLVLLAACGGNTDTSTTVAGNGSTTTEMSTETGNGLTMNSEVSTPAMTGQQFADMAASTDAYEIEAGKLAQQKGTSRAIKDFGAMMVENHTDSTAKLKTAAGAANPPITPNAALTADQEAMLQQLRAASGPDFDTAYRTQQVATHQKALAALEGYAASGDVPEIKSWARQTAPVVRSHLDRITGM